MATQVKLRKIGNSLGIVLPKEELAAMNVKEGDTLYVTRSSGDALRLNPSRPGFEEMMDIADDGMRRYRNALRELAK